MLKPNQIISYAVNVLDSLILVALFLLYYYVNLKQLCLFTNNKLWLLSDRVKTGQTNYVNPVKECCYV